MECKREWSKIVLFLSLLLSVHINLQHKSSSHKSLVIVTVNLFSSIALLTFSHLQFELLSLINLINMNK